MNRRHYLLLLSSGQNAADTKYGYVNENHLVEHR
jgi:hypothetical protein